MKKGGIYLLCVLIIAGASAFFLKQKYAFEHKSKPDVLFIAIDDLRPELGCYGSKLAISPIIDRLAKEGVVFEHAYCQYPVCLPSRLSVMAGTHVERFSRVRGREVPFEWRDFHPELFSLPQVLRENGYFTKSIGKIYDARYGLDNAESWSVPAIQKWGGFINDENKEKLTKIRKQKNAGMEAEKPPATEAGINFDEKYGDEMLCDLATSFLKSKKAKEQPFFLAVGFAKPHLPFTAPKKFWDLYEPAEIPVLSESAPRNHTEFTLCFYNEIFSYDVPNPITPESARTLHHGYLACVSFIDYLVGQLLDELKQQGLDGNTIVVLWSDHGFKLGDHGVWAKQTLLEKDARVPLIPKVPGEMKITSSEAMVELVDIFPTLCELTGVDVPETVEGISLMSLINGSESKIRDFALTQVTRPGAPYPETTMGYSIRTPNWRYVEWRSIGNDEVMARELYELGSSGKEEENVVYEREEKAKQHQEVLDRYLKGSIRLLPDGGVR